MNVKRNLSGLALGIMLEIGIVGSMTGCSSPHPAPGAATTVVAHNVAMPATTVVATTVPTTHASPSSATGPSSAAMSLPVSVQSDAAMRRAGNNGPTSSILAPASCVMRGANVTAEGAYVGGLAPQVYARYGDVVDLYVYTAPQQGYPDGIQLATPFTPRSPGVGGTGPWTVTVPVDRSLGVAARCVVAAQPTHDFQGAPSAY